MIQICANNNLSYVKFFKHKNQSLDDFFSLIRSVIKW